MELEAIIGLELHIELKTQSKMYCACANELSRGGEPNSQVCPICLGTPGTLPMINSEAVKQGARLALAFGADLQPVSVFARKHYTYPDLPKGFQITQYDRPLAVGGSVELESGEKVELERLHLEEDTAKMIHQSDGTTLINHNRAGVPLVELVTKPVLASPESARLFVQTLQERVKVLGVSDAAMQTGHLRVDANISLRPKGEGKLYSKTEIKNLNSTKSVHLALQYEIERQKKLWAENNPPTSMSTRGWDETKKETVLQRDKEEAKDYRYFPEPDLLPLKIADSDLATLKQEVDEKLLNISKTKGERENFASEFGLSVKDLSKIPAAMQTVFAAGVNEIVARMEGQGDMVVDEEQKISVARKWLGVWDKIKALKPDFSTEFIFARLPYLSDLLEKFLKKELTSTQLQEGVVVIATVADDDLTGLNEKLENLSGKMIDYKMLAAAVIDQYPELVEQYNKGKVAVIKFLVGTMMKHSKGAADAIEAENILKKLLAE